MKFIFTTVKYITFFLLGALTCFVLGTSAVSYIAIEEIATSENPNIKDLSRIAGSYVEELNKFDALTADLSGKNIPAICSTLCNASFMDKHRLREERTHYLVAYYKQQGPRALQDPAFLLTLDEIGFISRLFPRSLRDLLLEIEQLKQSPNESQKILLALKAETAALTEIASLGFDLDELKKSSQRLKSLRELSRSCQRGMPRKQVISECNSQMTN